MDAVGPEEEGALGAAAAAAGLALHSHSNELIAVAAAAGMAHFVGMPWQRQIGAWGPLPW